MQVDSLPEALEYILTPTSKSTITTNLPNSPNFGLGVNGLSNSVFLSHDLYDNMSNSSGDGYNMDGSGISNPGRNVVIRQTDSNGQLKKSRLL